MSAAARPAAGLLSRKGEAKPPTELYARFKAEVARHGLIGEEAIAAAIEQLIRDA